MGPGLDLGTLANTEQSREADTAAEQPGRPPAAGRKGDEGGRLQLAAIIESSDDAIISKTLEGIITSWNPGAERMFGYLASEAIGKSMLMLFPPDRANEEEEILTRIRRGERMEHFETARLRARVFRRSGELWIEDLGSTNGTYLNDERLESPSRLRRGDRVKVGSTILEVAR